jgi:hypothetical protein
MKTKMLIVSIFLAVAAALLVVAAPPAVTDGAKKKCSVTVSMLYGTEKREWIEEAAASFRRAHPEIELLLVGAGSLDAAQAILEGKQRPTIFSPADSLVMDMLASDWRTKHGAELFARTGDDAPHPLVVTPLVFVVWRDRAEALRRASGGTVNWTAIHRAVAADAGWPAIGGPPDWGFVKLGHTDPTRSNSGLEALWLMTLEFYGGRNEVQVGDLLRPDYQRFVREIERGVSRFEASTGTFMTDMIRFGPSKYDLALIYENLALAEIEHAEGRWGPLEIAYPAVTVWSDHPAAVLEAEWVSEAEKKAARDWLAHLSSRPVQERALAYGFRPADPAVAIRSSDPANPFVRGAAHGVQLDLPPIARTPDAALVRNLIAMWARVVAPR